MYKNKSAILVLGFVMSFIIGGNAFADEAPVAPVYRCTDQPATATEPAIIGTIQKDNFKVFGIVNESAYANAIKACSDNFNTQMDAYTQAQNSYLQSKEEANQAQSQAAAASATQNLEDAAAKLQRGSDNLKLTAEIVKILAGVAIAIGTMLLIQGAILNAAVLTAAAGTAMMIKGGIVLGGGIALMIIGGFIQKNSERMAREKAEICITHDKVASKKLNCPGAQEQQNGDGTFTINSSSPQLANIPEFIDNGTGKCSSKAPAECAALVNAAPPGCFKGKKGGPSCLAGIKMPPVKFVTKPNGTIVTSLNGKTASFSPSDFESEASMVKAGFTPAQAKQFQSLSNDPNGVLAKSGLNAKGELKNMPAYVMPASSYGANSGEAKPTAVMEMKKDEYGPAATTEVARAPASAEGLTKDYHGETIGADGDNLFKMVNRRYLLKQHQNIFLDQ